MFYHLPDPQIESDFLTMVKNSGFILTEVKRSNEQATLTKALKQLARIEKLIDILSRAEIGISLPCIKVMYFIFTIC